MTVWQVVFVSAMCFIAFTVIGLILYYFSIRKNMNRQKDKFEQLHLNLKAGDYVEFSNGIFGKVVKVETETCDIAIKSGAVMTVSRYAISDIIKK